MLKGLESDMHHRSHGGQGLSHLVKQRLGIKVILGPKPLVFEFAPQDFCNVEMRRIRGQVKDEQAALLPKRFAFPDGLSNVGRRVIQDHDGDTLQTQSFKGQFFQLLNNKARINILGGHFKVALVSARAPFGQCKAKQFTPWPLVLGMKTFSFLNCQAYGTHGCKEIRLSSP